MDESLEPWRGPGSGMPLEAQIRSRQQEGGRADAVERRNHPTRGRPGSADRPSTAAQSQQRSNEARFRGASHNQQGAANLAADSGTVPNTAGIHVSAATPDAAGTTPFTALGFHGSAATPESASFGATLDSALGRAGASASPQSEVLAIRIQKAVQAGQGRISLRLHPAELGRIDVQLDFAEDGRLRAAILAERSEALDLLQRDARLLERALQDAGLKTDSGSFTFDLRDKSAHDEAREESGQQHAGSAAMADDPDEIPVGSRQAGHDGLLDLTV